jgi:hypothetical protein
MLRKWNTRLDFVDYFAKVVPLTPSHRQPEAVPIVIRCAWLAENRAMIRC